MSKYDVAMEADEQSGAIKLMRRIHYGSKVLEFGSAEGRMTRYMKEKLACQVYIVELDSTAFQKARPYAEDGICGDAEQLGWLEKFGAIQFDHILFADVLEHLRDPGAVLINARRLLKENGSILISIPNIAHADILCNLYQNRFSYTPTGLLDNTHIHFWGEKDLDGFAEKAGLSIVDKDASYAEIFTTEQKSDFDLLPEELIRLFREKPFSNVYQFILVLQKSEWVKKQGIQPQSRLFTKAASTQASFYFDLGDGFSQAHMYAIQPVVDTGSGRWEYHLNEVPANCKALRFDPVEGFGVVLSKLRIECNKGILQAQVLNGYTRGADIVLPDDDPQLKIDLPADCHWVKASAFVHYLSKAGTNELKEVCRESSALLAEWDQQRLALVSEVKESHSFVEALEKELHESRTSYQLVSARLFETEKVKEDFNRRLDNALAKIEALDEQLKEIKAKNEILQEHLEWSETHARDLELCLNQTRDERQSFAELLEQYRGQNAMLEERYWVIANSQCWKLTVPLRKSLDFIKRIRVGGLAYKAAQYARTYGIWATIKKIWIYLTLRSADTGCGVQGDSPFPSLSALIQVIEASGGNVFEKETLRVWDNEWQGKRILLISHELNLTGAPVALQYFAESLLSGGNSPVVMAPHDDVLRKALTNKGIPVLTHGRLYHSNLVGMAVNQFDMVVISTIIGAPIVSALNGSEVSVLWWIHEAYASYHAATLSTMPERLDANVHVYCGGPYAAKVLRQYRPEYQIRQLLYFVPDYMQTLEERPLFKIKYAENKITFALVGMQEERKGQDILIHAIRMLPRERLARCMFVFVGRAYHPPIQKELFRLCEDFPRNVQVIEELNRDELMSFYACINCLICASRDDPMPIVVTEAMLMSKPIICSENTGSADLLEQMNSGLIYHQNSPVELAGCIEFVYENLNNLASMCDRARKTYERFFSQDTFDASVQVITQKLCSQREKWPDYDGTVSVIIPTYHAGDELKPLLESLKNQSGVAQVEIVIVDSGSEDGTAEIAEELGAKVIRISQSEFSHSFARNLGAQHASGEYLLFMTQDAIPNGAYWISQMLRPALEHGVVAISCRESPKPNCDLIGRMSIWLHSEFMGILAGDRIMTLPRQQNYDTLRRNGQLNDVACLVKRDVFEKFQYQGNYAEDLDLGIRLIRAGYKLALLSSVQVIHSHTRKAVYHLKRSIVDSSTLKKILPDLPTQNIDARQLINRLVTSYCAGVLYVRYLMESCDVPESLDEFSGRSAQKFDSIILDLQKMPVEEMQLLVDEETPFFDQEIKAFVYRLLECGNLDECDPTTVGDQRYFITHVLRRYLEGTGEAFTHELKREVCDLVVKLYGQLSGSLIACYCASHPDKNDILGKLIQDYSAGV